MLEKVGIIVGTSLCAIGLWKIKDILTMAFPSLSSKDHQKSSKSGLFTDAIAATRLTAWAGKDFQSNHINENDFFEPDCGTGKIEIASNPRSVYGNYARCHKPHGVCMKIGGCERAAWAEVTSITSKVNSDCDSKHTCRVHVSNGNFGDPSEGCQKKALITWRCKPAPTPAPIATRRPTPKPTTKTPTKKPTYPPNNDQADMFPLIDTNNDNFITRAEINAFATPVYKNSPEQKQLVNAIMTCDKNGDGKITLQEYSNIDASSSSCS